MTSDAPPEPTSLASGAAVGGALGAAASYLLKGEMPSLESLSVLSSLTTAGASESQEMKVGLPSF